MSEYRLALMELIDIEGKKRSTYPFPMKDIWGFDGSTDEWIIALGIWAGNNLETLRKALEGEWQPIATAPKDGSEICLYVMGNAGIPICDSTFWNGKEQGWCEWVNNRQPTHWSPLPTGENHDTSK